MKKKYKWLFPLTRTHCGILQGNGTFGVMIWGDQKLHITMNRADFWDHRGGMPFTEEMTYKNIRECLETNNEQRLRELFEGTPIEPGQPRRPSILPFGRLEIDFGEGSKILSGTLNLQSGEVNLKVEKDGEKYSILCALLMDKPCFYISIEEGLCIRSINRVSSWEYVGEYLKSISFDPPVMFDEDDLSGWIQMRPADPHICLGYKCNNNELIMALVYGNGENEAKDNAKDIINKVIKTGFKKTRKKNANWWKSYWRSVPSVKLPSENLEFIYYYGMYKFAGLTNPDGVAATLQGPWVEEYQMPPWSSDYHFNINVQECYWPTFAGNRLDHIKPLFNMINSWEDKLRHNAKMFLGIDDGLMLPHAVDDRCTCMGGFWTGSIDHGSTSWVAQLMWLYYKYSMDDEFLRDIAYPFMKGAMRVYEEMLEDKDGELSLPISVSPEYGGSSMHAWGKNASFQLSIIHFLCRALCEASEILEINEGIEKWEDIDHRLPDFSTINNRIALWEGQDLAVSHRHHSHLAGIYPFDTLEYEKGGKHYQIVQNTITHWIHKGIGEWSGWCMPWASIIHSRLGNGEAAEAILELWKRFFTNEGNGTLHDVRYPGISIMGMGRTGGEIMQIEAGMGAITAVQEMLLHSAKGIIKIFPAIPDHWRNASFYGMRAEGAFLVSAKYKDGQITKIEVFSEKGSLLRIYNNISKAVLVKRDYLGTEEVISDEIIDISTHIGETIILIPYIQ
ncbi:MAG: glycosyl hydrolase family 95 catalytic domain-containing protein [Candidatus Poribacteria bacterium]